MPTPEPTPVVEPAPTAPVAISNEDLVLLASKLRSGDAAIDTKLADADTKIDAVVASVATVSADVASLRSVMADMVAGMTKLTEAIPAPAPAPAATPVVAPVPDVSVRTAQHPSPVLPVVEPASAPVVDGDGGDEDSPLVAALRKSWTVTDKGPILASSKELDATLRSLCHAGGEIGHFVEPRR